MVCVCVCVYSFILALLTFKSFVRQVVRLLDQWLSSRVSELDWDYIRLPVDNTNSATYGMIRESVRRFIRLNWVWASWTCENNIDRS